MNLRTCRRLFSVSIIVLSGCFPMGLPEVFAPVEVQKSPDTRLERMLLGSRNAARNILVISHPESASKTLGHQYVFGIFPVTRLYYPHGLQRQLEQIFISEASDAGYRVFVADTSSRAAVATTLHPDAVVSLQISEASLNAFDLLFFRTVRFNALLELRTLSQSPSGGSFESPSYQAAIPLSETSYRSIALAPTLAVIVEKSVRSALRKELPSLLSRNISPRMSDASHTGNIVQILPPSFETPPLPELAKEFSASYGFSSLPPMTDRSLSRIISLGLRNGLRETNIQSFESAPIEIQSENIWQLRSTAQITRHKISALSPLQIKYTFHLFDKNDGRIAPISSRICTAQPVLDRSADGNLVLALEQSAADAIKTFLGHVSENQMNENGVRCTD